MPKGVYERTSPPQPRQGAWGLADYCYESAGGDPVAALLLALDIQRIAAQPRWPLEELEPGPRIRGSVQAAVEEAA